MRILLAILILTSVAAADVSGLYFGSESCGPCRSLRPSLARLQRAYTVNHVDAGDGTTAATVRQYGVTRLPTIVFLDDGVEIDRIIGSSGDWHRRCVERLAGRNSWRPIRAAVRVRCGNGIGSGVILSSVPGNTVIATAAHIVQGQETATVELWRDDGIKRYSATVARINNTTDLALLTVVSNSLPLPSVIGADRQAEISATVFGVGCSRGGKPSVMACRVLSLDGGDVYASGAPAQGRSGGGLYNRRFELIGICSAANAERQDGWYVGHEKLKQLLEEWNPTQYRQRRGGLSLGVGIGFASSVPAGPCRDPNCPNCRPRPRPTPTQTGRIGDRGLPGITGPMGPPGRNGSDGVSPDVAGLLARIEALEKQKRRVILVDGKSKAVIDDESYAADEPILIDVQNLVAE